MPAAADEGKIYLHYGCMLQQTPLAERGPSGMKMDLKEEEFVLPRFNHEGYCSYSSAKLITYVI